MVLQVCVSSLLATMLVYYSLSCRAQTVLQQAEFCQTSLPNQPRPTFFSVDRYQSGGYQLRNSAGDNIAIQENSSIAVRLRAPLVLRPGLKVVGSFTYYDEDFEFVSEEASPSFTGALHNKALRSLNASFYVVKPFRSDWFLINRLQTSLSGDFNQPSEQGYLNYSLASVLGWRKSENTVLGAGLFYGRDFDGGSLVPLLAYQHSFNDRWSIDALLPVQTAVQYYSANQKNVLKAGVQLNGPEYNIALNYAAAAANQYVFERSEVRWSVSEQREIHDWVWLRLEAGVNTPLGTNWQATSEGLNEANSYTFDTSFYTMFSLVLVAPRKLFNQAH